MKSIDIFFDIYARKTMIKALIPYCPALPRMCSPRYRGGQADMFRKAIKLVKKERIFIITGPHENGLDGFEANRRIGKTYMAEKLKSAYEDNGSRVVMKNIYDMTTEAEKIAVEHCFNGKRFNRQVYGLPDADIYIFDEIQGGFVMDCLSREYPSEQLNKSLQCLWRKIGRLLTADKKIIFVTAVHPFNRFHEACWYDSVSINYFVSPIIEIDPTGARIPS